MKTNLILILLFCFSLLSSQENLYSINDYIIELDGSNLSVKNESGEKTFSKFFRGSNLLGFPVDLDNDGITEFLLNSYNEKDNLKYFSVYIFLAADSFLLVDSIYSGLTEPYTTYSDEINETLLITGSPDFDTLYSAKLDTFFSPLYCWTFNSSELRIVNDQLNDIFISENESIMDFIDLFMNNIDESCNTSFILKQAIAAVYANFISAEETVSAEAFLKKYYNCPDLETFKDFVKKLL